MKPDVIIVGGRCAGAATALLLARRGHRVLLLDRSALPSDAVLSTHFVHQSGAGLLAHWGLLDEVRASGCPPVSRITFDTGPVVLTGTATPSKGAPEAWAPRRIVLDRILLDAASRAGVEVNDRTTLVDLLVDDGCVGGVRVRSRDGTTYDVRAPLVIGADGRHSSVAKLVGARFTVHRPSLQGTYFAYWSDVTITDAQIYVREGRTMYAWPTNEGLTLIGVNWPISTYNEVRRDPGRHVLASLDAFAPELAAAVRAADRQSRWIGTSSASTFYRVSHGQGWALVGDAGYSLDPGTAQGISDAFRDAQGLADAVHTGFSQPASLDALLDAHYRHRDETSRPMCDFTYQLSALNALPPEITTLFAALADNQPQTDQFFGVLAGTVPVQAFFAPDNVANIIGGLAPPAARSMAPTW